MAGSYPSQRQAASMLALQAAPHEQYGSPEAWGCAPPLIWRIDRRENEYVVVGRTLDELKELRNGC